MDPLTQGQPQDQFQPIAPPAQDTPVLPPEPAPAPVSQSAPAVDDKQQVIDKIRSSKSVLVTVGANPSVDELASALGLTVMLSRLDKHVTAVFSGKIPPAIEFLDPEATFEDSVDSLRDFIIALSKDKADKLRYKVEDDVVKVFITPYKTVLTEKDLEFSQGDLNVDVVVALGVASEEELDKALLAHGKVLHSAAIVTINAGDQTSNLGMANWHDPEVSSIAELLVAVGEALGPNLLDEQSSTALLTGIVAETNRFSNEKTTPKVMTISAQLMAAGANQQLVATNLRQEGMITESIRTKKSKDDASSDDGGEVVLEHGSKKTKVKPSDARKGSAADDNAQEDASSKDEEPGESTSDEDASLAALKSAVDESTAEVAPAEPEADVPKLEEFSSEMPAEPKADTADATANMPKLAPLSTMSSEQPVLEPLPSLADNPTITDEATATPEQAADDVDLDAARQAVEAAGEPEPPKDPSPADVPEPPVLPAIDGGVPGPADPAQPLAFTPPPFNPGETDAPAPEEPAPMDAFMGTHADAQGQSDLNALTTPSSPAPAMPGAMPPLPPMPPTGDQTGLPPMPPLPGQPSDPSAGFQPQINPGFMQDMPQSQNTWTQAADDLSAQNADKAAARQETMDKKAQDYDQMVDRNRELQGLPPLNDPNGSGLPPLPPTPGA